MTTISSADGDFGTPVCEHLTQLGGVATYQQLRAHATRAAIDRAVADGSVIRTGRGRFAIPSTDQSVRLAHAVGGVLCLTSAALHHGWAVKLPSERPHVAFAKNRRLAPEQTRKVKVHRATLRAEDVVDGIATSKELTLIQCFRTLPYDEALAIADSAARAGEETLLRKLRMHRTGRGAARIRRVAADARPQAANPFESVLRAIANTIDGLNVVPQRLITSVTPWAKPDLTDVDLCIVIEADSFEWHGDRHALRRDARRYDLLVADGWIVLRFAWEDVMFDQNFVRAVLTAVVRIAQQRTKPNCPRCDCA